MTNGFSFTPSQSGEAALRIPYLEDARSNYAPYYATSIKVPGAMDAVTKELAKLGGSNPRFVEGTFTIAGQKRYGYKINFWYGGMSAEIVVAGLPIRAAETPNKKTRVLAQALLIVRDQLKAAVVGKVFAPTSDPLMQYLLIADGSKTVAQAMHQSGQLPQLMPPISYQENP